MTAVFSDLIATKLNSGLVRLAQPPRVFATPLQKVRIEGGTRSSSVRRRGSVFRVGALHRKPLTPATLRRNRRGYLNAQITSVAHAPSLYHWLFHRCGIPFEETQALVRGGGLRVGGAPLASLAEAEVQRPWLDWQQRDVQVRTHVPAVVAASNATAAGKREDGEEGVFVPALQRALHRRFFMFYTHPGLSLSSEAEDPKSFVHRLSPLLEPCEALGLNVLRPIGFMNSMCGLAIATNDVSVVRYWNSEHLGNYGVFDVRFPLGTPTEVVEAAHTFISKALEDVARQLPRCFTEDHQAGRRGQSVSSVSRQGTLPRPPAVVCRSSIEPVPPPQRDIALLCHKTLFDLLNHSGSHRRKREGPLEPRKMDQQRRLLVSTPLFPYRVTRQLRRHGALISLIRSGPFVLPPQLPMCAPGGGGDAPLAPGVLRGCRSLTPEELALLFSFERRLKVNRLVLSLREFDSDKEEE